MTSCKVSTKELFESTVKGDEFFRATTIINPVFLSRSRTKFSVNRQMVDFDVNYPTEPEYFFDGTVKKSLSALKKDYIDKYGPYSVEAFTKKIRAAFVNFAESVSMTPNRQLIRKLWLFKQIFEICEISINMIVVRMVKLIPSLYEKAIKTLDAAEIRKKELSPKAEKQADTFIATIKRVNDKIKNIMTEDPKFLKLLSPDLLLRFSKDATPYMVSKINCLPWIEPDLAEIASPGYNYYWTDFWFYFLDRNLKLTSDACYVIAEYMPIPLRIETFLDFFRRKYDARNGVFLGKRLFDLEKSEVRKNGQYLNNVTITFN